MAARLLEFHEVAYWLTTSAIEERRIPLAEPHWVEFCSLYRQLRRNGWPELEHCHDCDLAKLKHFRHSALENYVVDQVDPRRVNTSFTVRLSDDGFTRLMAALGRRFTVANDSVRTYYWHDGTYSLAVRLKSGRVLHVPDSAGSFVLGPAGRYTIAVEDGELVLPHNGRRVSADELKATIGVVELPGRHLWPKWKEPALARGNRHQ